MTELNSPKYKHGSFYLWNSKKSISLKIRISDVPHTLNFSYIYHNHHVIFMTSSVIYYDVILSYVFYLTVTEFADHFGTV